MTVIHLSNPAGAKAAVSRYGAHLLSWSTGCGKDWIFLSKKALFEPGKAIRGGVPVIFPQFNEFGSGMRHGFARISEWTLEENARQSPHQVMLSLHSSEATRSRWPWDFAARYCVVLQEEQLSMTLMVENTDSKPIEFTAALHTYLKVNDFAQARIQGLQDYSFWDNDSGPFTQRSPFRDAELCFTDAIDRVYFAVDRPLRLRDGADELGIAMTGFKDVVIWNPGAEAARGLVDLDDAEYLQMLCVEAACIDQPVRLEPGETWQGSQILRRSRVSL